MDPYVFIACFIGLPCSILALLLAVLAVYHQRKEPVDEHRARRGSYLLVPVVIEAGTPHARVVYITQSLYDRVKACAVYSTPGDTPEQDTQPNASIRVP